MHGARVWWRLPEQAHRPGDVAVSSGCIRMTNDDIIDLYSRVRVGARVIVQR